MPAAMWKKPISSRRKHLFEMPAAARLKYSATNAGVIPATLAPYICPRLTIKCIFLHQNIPLKHYSFI